MKSLSSQEKKLYSSIGIVLGIIFVCGAIYIGVNSLSDYWKNRYIKKEQALIEKYETKIDSITKENAKLTIHISELDTQIDSLYKVKNKIIWKYEKEKVNIVNNATASDHAIWLDTILSTLKSN